MPDLRRAEGAEPGRGYRDSYRKDRCVDCPEDAEPPAMVWECDDGRKRCYHHRAARTTAFAHQLELRL